jgi:hypothetical protein
VAELVSFPPKPHVEDYWGGCPVCGRNDGFMTVSWPSDEGRHCEHWIVCHRHRVRWSIGGPLFSTSKTLSLERQQANYRRLVSYRQVEPLPHADWQPLFDASREVAP